MPSVPANCFRKGPVVMKEKRFSLRGLLVAVLLTVLGTLALLAGVLFFLLGKDGLSMAEAVVLINTSFVGDHDMGTAIDGSMNTLISGLGDRWSYYMDADGYTQQKESKDNAYVGIGATVSYPQGDGLLVESVVAGGPADQAGLKAGDTILSVDGTALTQENRQKGTELTRGPEGSSVVLSIRRTDGTETELTVVRARVEEHPVSYQLLEDGTGLVTIRNFNSRCADEAIAAVDDLAGQGASRLVFDVRNNGGGYLDELTKLLDHLLPEGIIFRSEDKAGHKEAVESDASCVKLPMAILVNGNTYSAAEFFAAELQEMHWGVIIGTPTYGKGFSQQTFPLLSGGAINISTAKYFTGNGVSLIGTGLTLDQQVELTDKQTQALGNHSLAPADDPQLQTAIEMLNHPETGK